MAKNYFDGGKMNNKFDGRRKGKLGSHYNPAVINVHTKTRAKELEAIFKKNNWQYKIEMDKKKSEDITDLELLQNPTKPLMVEKKAGRNEPCPCGSGKKYKQCCMK